MTNPNLTEIIFVIDRSSSMIPSADEVIDGFNKFLNEQRNAEGIALITLSLFDTSKEILLNGKLLNEIPENFLNRNNYVPRGMTALFDAVGMTIDQVGKRLLETPENERPGKVMMVIMTDGAENASREYLGTRVPDMIKHQRENYSWEFVYLGANVDAAAVANDYNIPVMNSMNYSQRAGGTKDLFRSLGASVKQYRYSGKVKLENSN